MTVQEIYEAALARAMEFSQVVPNTFSVSVSRMRQRQEQLFARIAAENRDYAGRAAVLPLAAGIADTATLDPPPMRIYRVVVADPGASGYASGSKVAIVPVDDLECEVAPRATLRDGMLEGVALDLFDVVSVTVFYSRRPDSLEHASDVPDLPEQFHELLVIDLAKSLIRKTIGLNATSRKEIMDVLSLEEDELLEQFSEFLLKFNYAEVTRFGRTAGQ